MQFIGIIPARYGSTRYPGKPLAMIRGKTMIQRVYEQSCKCRLLDDVVVATDDQRIFNHVQTFGKALMTDSRHTSGTSRCLEAFQIMNTRNAYTESDGVINIQGDEPFIDPSQIEQVIGGLKEGGKGIVTLARIIEREQDIHNPNIVKLVFTVTGKALYFSRSPIPWAGKPGDGQGAAGTIRHYKHIGLYGYRADTLEKIVSLPAGSLEATEKLEQLRWMQHDFEIFVKETYTDSKSVDTPEDAKGMQ